MAPLTTFIAMIKGWHAITVLAFTLILIILSSYFSADRTTPVTWLKDAIFQLIGIPVMLFTLFFLMYALPNRQFGAAQLFPSVFLVLSAFMAVAITGAMRDDPSFPPSIAIPMGLALSLVMSGLVVGMRFLFPKIF